MKPGFVFETGFPSPAAESDGPERNPVLKKKPGFAHCRERPMSQIPIGAAEIRAAAERLAPWAHRTPVMTSRTLDDRCGGTVFLKCENLQRVGAFKFRGAMNAVLQLTEEERC